MHVQKENFYNSKWILVLNIVDLDGFENEGNPQMLPTLPQLGLCNASYRLPQYTH